MEDYGNESLDYLLDLTERFRDSAEVLSSVIKLVQENSKLTGNDLLLIAQTYKELKQLTLTIKTYNELNDNPVLKEAEKHFEDCLKAYEFGLKGLLGEILKIN